MKRTLNKALRRIDDWLLTWYKRAVINHVIDQVNDQNLPLQKVDALNNACLTIRDKIIRLEIPPGQPLNTRALAKELKIGMAPLRDALQMLQKERLVEVIPRRGTYTTAMSLAQLQTAFDARLLVERAIWRLAASRISEQEIEDLQRWFLDMRLAANERDHPSIVELDSQFHRLVAQSAGNVYLEDFLSSVLPTTQRILYYVFNQAEDKDETLAEAAGSHQSLLEALKKRSPDLTEESITQHILNLRRRCVNLLERPGISLAV